MALQVRSWTATEEAELRRRAASRTLPARVVERAKLICCLQDGDRVPQVAERLGLGADVVRSCQDLGQKPDGLTAGAEGVEAAVELADTGGLRPDADAAHASGGELDPPWHGAHLLDQAHDPEPAQPRGALSEPAARPAQAVVGPLPP